PSLPLGRDHEGSDKSCLSCPVTSKTTIGEREKGRPMQKSIRQRFTDHLLRNPGLSARPVIQRELDAPRAAFLQPYAGQGDFIPHLDATFRSLERGFYQPVVAADFPMACTRSTPVLVPVFALPQGWRRDPLCYDNARWLTC
ncbi:hypothetical protein SOP85_31170, partial [Pseudomonas sp. YuFO20]|uniref:hypothetical protein n=1 Tax=Pseudomonas sp. YuFO20 TaxID=3095362 RepID=UPI002B2482C1